MQWISGTCKLSKGSLSPATLQHQAYCAVLTGPDAYLNLVQAPVCEHSGPLPLDANEKSPGLQALVRLYCSSPQQLGYVPPGLPPPTTLVDGRVVTPLTRLVPEPAKGYFSLSAADVVLGKVGGEEVVMKTSSNIDHEVCYVHGLHNKQHQS